MGAAYCPAMTPVVVLVLALLVVNAGVYTAMEAKRGEPLVGSLVSNLLLGPYVWIGWRVRRAAGRREGVTERRG